MQDFKLPIESEKTLIEKKTDVAIYREININCWQREITMRIYRLLFLSRWATARQRSVFWREIPCVKRKSQSIELLFKKKWYRCSKMKVPWTTISKYWCCWARRGVRRQGGSRVFSMLWAKVLHITNDWKQWKSSVIRHDMQSAIPEIVHCIKFVSSLCGPVSLWGWCYHFRDFDKML